jgi:hypothetical protein
MSKCNDGNCKNCNCKENQSLGETRYAFFEGLERYIDNPALVGTGYTLILTDPGTEDGYKIGFKTEISIFDFFNIFQEYFDGKKLEVDVLYNEEED